MMSTHRKFLTRLSLFFSMSILLLASCATVPMTEFTSYRDAVNQAREASEDILIDFAAAKADFEATSKSTGSHKISARHNGFNPSKHPVKSNSIDTVAVRLKAWETLILYNKALEAVMQDKNSTEVQGATTELLNTMSSFPSDKIQEFASDLNPAIRLLTEVISLAQQEYDRRKALDNIVKVGPYISTNFISLLKKDVTIFYNVRMGINDIAYVQQLSETTILIKRYITLAETVKEEPKVVVLTSKINTVLSGIPVDKDGQAIYEPIPHKYLGAQLTELEFEQLQNLASQIESKAVRLDAIDEELYAYQKTLYSYLDMIDHMDATLRGLIAKAQLNQTVTSDNSELLHSIIRLKEAYQTYQNNKQ